MSDWETVTILRKKAPKASHMKSEQATKKPKLTAAEKQKRYREKRRSDAEREAAYKAKHKIRNARRKKIGEMSDREQRSQRKMWRKWDKERRKKESTQLQLPPTPPEENSSNDLPSGYQVRGRRKVLRNRSKCVRDNTKLKDQAVNKARREGAAVDTQQKWGGGQNKQHVTTKNTAKLDRETEELKHNKVPLDLGKLIQQGRQAKGWSQKDLATKCNEKPQVINDYEAGRGIPNQVVIGKIEKALGIKLRGKDMGCQLLPPGAKQ